jgi:CRP-like cAMP-binding protein
MKSILMECCSPEWLDFIKHFSKKLDFPAKGIIFKQGDEATGVYFVDHGKVKISTSLGNQNEKLIRLAADGDIFGHRGLYGDWTYPITAQALTPTSVTLIPKEILVQALKANQELTYQLMIFFAEELRLSETRNMLLPARSKVSAAILMNYETFGLESENGTKLSYTISRQDIANHAGLTYETVIRELGQLNEMGIIKISGKALHVLQPDLLKAIATGKSS